jgi:Helix-turn-helix domain
MAKSASVPTRWQLLIRARRDLSSNAKLIGLTLSTYMDNRTGEAFPSQVQLAADTGRHKSTVWGGLNELKEAGVLGSRRRWNSSNVYAALFADSGYSEVSTTSNWQTRSDMTGSDFGYSEGGVRPQAELTAQGTTHLTAHTTAQATEGSEAPPGEEKEARSNYLEKARRLPQGEKLRLWESIPSEDRMRKEGETNEAYRERAARLVMERKALTALTTSTASPF